MSLLLLFQNQETSTGGDSDRAAHPGLWRARQQARRVRGGAATTASGGFAWQRVSGDTEPATTRHVVAVVDMPPLTFTATVRAELTPPRTIPRLVEARQFEPTIRTRWTRYDQLAEVQRQEEWLLENGHDPY